MSDTDYSLCLQNPYRAAPYPLNPLQFYPWVKSLAVAWLFNICVFVKTA